MNKMKCMSCRTGEMVESTNTYFAQVDGGFLIIKNVPCLKCNQCGEVFYRASVLEHLEEMAASFRQQHSELSITDYNQAA
ncbi:MAG: type II toxin-antitoxin system MqsA family antitoxin [Lachnospiraceae bacterium]|nr:type II toxin-antitoxin system MqsA family antitoxin [Lachnospiraceae bacterium]